MKFFLVACCLLGIYFAATAQDKTLKYEGQLIVDNDAFTGNLTQDQYYSSGVYASFRILIDSSERAKIIRSYQLNHQMYTPSWIGEQVPAFRDRPYAGVISFNITNEYYFYLGHYLKAQFELGWMGPKTDMGKTQSTWHGWFGMTQPLGWDEQIQDSPLVGVNLIHLYSYFSQPNFDISGETNLKVGTVYNLARYDLVLRLGRLKSMINSAYLSSGLGNIENRSPENQTVESYIFYSPGLERVFYNATLQGNLIGPESPVTTDATKWVWQHRVGVMFSWSIFDLGFIAYWRKNENPEATNHNYVGIRLNYRH